jgi:ribonuclease HII
MITPTLQFEQSLWHQGYRAVVGLDEVGRGSWAGPVVAAAVVVSPEFAPPQVADTSSYQFSLIRDSKLLSPAQRQRAVTYLSADPQFSSGIGQASVAEISQLGIARATYLAMQRAVDQLPVTIDYALVDGLGSPDLPVSQQSIVKGDAYSLSIAAASILAKEYRDNLMRQLAVEYPLYQLDQHMGYGTRAHQQAILDHGLTVIHRTGWQFKFLSSD